MGRAGYDTTDPSTYGSSAAYNAIAMHRAQALIEQEAADDRAAEAALEKAMRQKKSTGLQDAERAAKKARLAADAAAEKLEKAKAAKR